MNIDNAKLQAKATNRPITWRSSWGDCEGEHTVTYLGKGFLHWWIPNDGTNSGAEVFSTSPECERPDGVPEYASYFRKEGSVFRVEYDGYRNGWSESESYLLRLNPSPHSYIYHRCYAVGYLQIETS